MAAKITVRNNQNLFDICLQVSGGIQASEGLPPLFELAMANGVSITDALVAGGELQAEISVADSDILKYYIKENIKPATGNTDQLEVSILEGIDYWAIGVDFIVS